ncbi:MAG: DNA primase [Chloroflexota bacterium]
MARDAVAEVRERTDIVELVSAYVPLKRAGRSYKGNCPFHQERTPSFIVFPDSQNFHCFGCGKGGDAFTFYMGMEHVEFREALQELARRAGVELQSVPAVAPEVDAHRQRLIDLNEQAATFYANILVNSEMGRPGREYVERRGLAPEVISRFGLGFAPDAWDTLLRFLAQRGIDPGLAHEAGLLQERDSGGHYDRFRGRLLFPIRTREGRTVGFGGRALGDAQPKYLNSPQSAIFDKSSLVYGLDLARDAIRARDEAVIVEGYMDCIAAHQFGHANVVACMGTAVTEEQVAQVKRLSRKIVLALDADAAGQMATLRSLEMLPGALGEEAGPEPVLAAGRGASPQVVVSWERKLNAEIRIVQLPEGKDPDDLIRRNPAAWPEVVAGARPFLDFFIDGVTAGIPASDGRAKAAAVARIAPVVRAVGDRIQEAHYAALIARKLGLPDGSVLAEIRRGGASPRAAAPGAVAAPAGRLAALPQPPATASREDHLASLLLAHRPILAGLLPQVREDDFFDARNRELHRVLADPAIPADLGPEAIIAGLEDNVADHAERLVADLERTPIRYPGQIERDAVTTLAQLRQTRYRDQIAALQAQIRDAQEQGEAAEVEDLTARLSALAARHAEFEPPVSPYFRDLRNFRSSGQ